MANKKDPNKKHYFQSATCEEFAETMQMFCSLDKPFPLTVWEKGEDEQKAELYIATEYHSSSKIIKMKPTGKLATKIMGSQKAAKEVLVKIPIENRINYFTGGNFKFHPEDLSYSLEINQEIFMSQQRENFRLNASASIPIQFKINEQVFAALDISTGGTSFAIDEDNKSSFPKGSVHKECTLRFDRKNYYVPLAKVAALLPLTDEEGNKIDGKIKVGIAFKDLPKKTEEELYIKISTEARGEEMKKKFDIAFAKKPDPT